MVDGIEYGGHRYYLGDDGYYRKNSNQGECLLHRQIYTDHHGPIPDGIDIHHLDHDKSNNDPGNLSQRTRAEHFAEHGGERGADWHSRGGRATQAAIHAAPPASCVCRSCGETFTTYAPSGRADFCSGKCRERHYHATGTGRPHERRVCAVCGNGFDTRADRAAATCSRPCTAVLAYRRRAARVRPPD